MILKYIHFKMLSSLKNIITLSFLTNPLKSELFLLGLLGISTSFRNLLYMAAVMSFQGAQGTWSAWQGLLEVFFQPCRRRKTSSKPLKKQPGIQQPLPCEVQVAEMKLEVNCSCC